MSTQSRKHRRAVAVGGVLLGAVLALLWWNGQQDYDRSFDTSVVSPAYPAGGPVVLFDEGHLNTHTTSGGYKPLADLMRNDGYVVRVSTGPMSARALDDVTVLVVALPRGANDANDGPAFAVPEVALIGRWVEGGGALLLIADHWPYGPAAASLAKRFDVQLGGGLVEEPDHHDPVRGASHVIFSAANGLLGDHPITRGSNTAERIARVLTFTGTSVYGPPSAVRFLALSPTAVEYPPALPKVDRSGGNVRVSMEYGGPVPITGAGQGLALERERGRVVILGEAGLFRAQRPRGGAPVGMNVAGYDNRQLALNVVRWLSRRL